MSAVWTLTAVGGAAQQQAPPPEPPAPASAAGSAADEQVKLQVRNFEAILRSAVESGGRRLQKRADEMLPVAPTLAMVGEPVVLGAPHPDGGFVFTVQVPDILPSGVQITMMQMQRNSAARPVATAPDKVAAAGVVPDDPVRPVRPPFNPDREYSDFVREALIEAMIENSQALGVGSTGDLVVIASVPDAVRRNPLDTSRLLILSVKGEHIQAYRQGRINKEEMKLRVGDRRF
jgi:hypothetical protein